MVAALGLFPQLQAQSWELGFSLSSARPQTGNQSSRTEYQVTETRLQGPWVSLPIEAGYCLTSWSWKRDVIQLWVVGQYGVSVSANDYYWDSTQVSQETGDRLQVVQGRIKSNTSNLGLRLDVPLGSLGQYGRGRWFIGLGWQATNMSMDGRKYVLSATEDLADPNFHLSSQKGEVVAKMGLTSSQEFATYHLFQRLAIQVPLGTKGNDLSLAAPGLDQARPGVSLQLGIGMQFK